MRVLTLMAVFGVLAASNLAAAPVPKEKPKEKTTEEKLIGKWKLVKSGVGLPEGFDFTIDYQPKGVLSFTRKSEDGSSVSPGKYKVGKDTIEWTVTEGGADRGETSKIKLLTETKLTLEDPEGIVEEFERVVEKKKEPKKD